MDARFIDDLARRLAAAVPPGLSALRRDLEDNFKSVLQSGLTRLDLVSRQEFDVQAAVLRRINEYEPSVVATFNSEHYEDEKLGKELNHSVEKVLNSSTLMEKIVSGRELTEAFVRFMVFNLNHMAKEENILNKVLWRYYSDEEIKYLSKQISESVAPWMQDFYARWMLRGINNSEAADWMKAVESGAPAIVFQTLLQKAEQELPVKRFRKITQSLSEGALVA